MSFMTFATAAAAAVGVVVRPLFKRDLCLQQYWDVALAISISIHDNVQGTKVLVSIVYSYVMQKIIKSI